MWDLGTLDGGSRAFGVNRYGDITGNSDRLIGEGYQSRAFISRHGIAMQELDDLVLYLGDWTLISATGITDDGYICGWGYKGANSIPRAFLLKPYY